VVLDMFSGALGRGLLSLVVTGIWLAMTGRQEEVEKRATSTGYMGDAALLVVARALHSEQRTLCYGDRR